MILCSSNYCVRTTKASRQLACAYLGTRPLVQRGKNQWVVHEDGRVSFGTSQRYAVRTFARTGAKGDHSQVIHRCSHRLPSARGPDVLVVRNAHDGALTPDTQCLAVRPFLNREQAPRGRVLCQSQRCSSSQSEARILHLGTILLANLALVSGVLLNLLW